MDEFTSRDEEKEFLDHVRGIAKKAFWDNIYSDINEQKFDKVVSVLEDLQNRLTQLIPNNHNIQEEIKKELDIPLVKQQLENGAFDCDDFLTLFDCFCTWLLHLGSPAWDNNTKQFRNSIHSGVKERGYVEMLKYALDGLNDGITITEYEIEEFNKKLKENK